MFDLAVLGCSFREANGDPTHLSDRLLHGCQRWIDMCPQRKAIESDNGDITRHSDAA